MKDFCRFFSLVARMFVQKMVKTEEKGNQITCVVNFVI